jgi:hypothetical protein
MFNLGNTMLPSTKALISKLRKSMGDYAFVRYQKNLGISFEDCYFNMFGKLPKVEG